MNVNEFDIWYDSTIKDIEKNRLPDPVKCKQNELYYPLNFEEIRRQPSMNPDPSVGLFDVKIIKFRKYWKDGTWKWKRIA